MKGDGRKDIQSQVKSVRALLSGTKYSLDYYQREYKWASKQVVALIEDLTGKFLEGYEKETKREEATGHGDYFLGTILISEKEGHRFIIDGQQRLTTLTLLLVFLNNLEQGREDAANISDLIYSVKYGRKTFNLNVRERNRCMEALLRRKPFNAADKPESIRNLLARYEDIERIFPGDLRGETLPDFIAWLLEKVCLVEITAYSEEEAYTIFETIHSRGRSPSPLLMLRDYLLSNVSDEAKRSRAKATWKRISDELGEIGSDETADFIKAWLRSHYALSIRDRNKDTKPKDFERIDIDFHRWVRARKADLGLINSEDFLRFINQDLVFYARQYKLIHQASLEYSPPLEDIYHIARLGFSLQYPILLSPLHPDDTQVAIERKLMVTAAFIDILLARRLWNWRSISSSSLKQMVFSIIRDIRSKPAEELALILKERLESQEASFTYNIHFSMNKKNQYMVHCLLARITDYLEQRSGKTSCYLDYIGANRERYEVEHIWADNPEWHLDEFDHPDEFSGYRNRIGDLLLVPRSFKTSYGHLPYEDKLERYLDQNLLARSLHPKCYEVHDGFVEYVLRSGLPFQPHLNFNKADIDYRQVLYTLLAEEVWNPNRLEAALI